MTPPNTGCSGPCDQGRKPCPHPEVCEQFDGAGLGEVLGSLLWPIAVVGGAALLGFIGRSLGWW